MIKAFTAVLGDSASSTVAQKVKRGAVDCRGLVDVHWARMANGRVGRNGKRLEGRDFAAMEILELAEKA